MAADSETIPLAIQHAIITMRYVSNLTFVRIAETVGVEAPRASAVWDQAISRASSMTLVDLLACTTPELPNVGVKDDSRLEGAVKARYKKHRGHIR